MSKKAMIIILIILLVGVGIGGYFIYKNSQKPKQNENKTQEQQVPSATSSEQTNTATKVKVVNYKFNPDSIKIKKGTAVTWTNDDSVIHTVTSDNGAFDSGSLKKGQSFSFTFNQAGEFNYHCTPHPYMKAKVIVE